MRVKRGTTRARERTRLLKQTKGYRLGRKKLYRLAKTAILKAGVYAYRDRRNKKRVARRGWNVVINAAVRPHAMSYSRFIDALKKKNILLDRKMLTELAKTEPETFTALVKQVKERA